MRIHEKYPRDHQTVVYLPYAHGAEKGKGHVVCIGLPSLEKIGGGHCQGKESAEECYKRYYYT